MSSRSGGATGASAGGPTSRPTSPARTRPRRCQTAWRPPGAEDPARCPRSPGGSSPSPTPSASSSRSTASSSRGATSSITSVVDAPRRVSSDARPTRAEWAVTRASTPADRAAAWNRSPTICGDSGTTRSSGPGLAARAQRPDGDGDIGLHEPHVPRLAVRVRLAAPDRHQHPVAGGRLGDVAPEQGAHLAAPHPRHEEQPRDHRVKPTALQGDVAGLDAAAAATRPVAGGEDRGQVRRHEGARLAAGRGRRRSAGSPPAPGPFFRRPGSARRRDGPGSAPRLPPSTRSTGLSPARGARRGSRPGSRPRDAGRRARRRGGAAPRSTPDGCSG